MPSRMSAATVAPAAAPKRRPANSLSSVVGHIPLQSTTRLGTAQPLVQASGARSGAMRLPFALLAALFAAPPATAADPVRLSPDQALAADAERYAAAFGLGLAEAQRRLDQQRASITVTDV